MNLSSDALVLRLTHECFTNFVSMSDFYKKNIEWLSRIHKKITPIIDSGNANNITAEATVTGARMSSILVSRLITVVNSAKHYSSIDRSASPHNMSYSSVSANFKIEHEDCFSTRDEVEPKAPKTNNRRNDWKIIRWAPMFKDYLVISHGSRRPLRYALREHTVTPDKNVNPLLTNYHCGESGSLIYELESLLHYEGPICENDNASVHVKIEEAAR